ncbi:21432_t:CDS:2 [Cetraspora pellucida]|uniref:21432_t:CDS:1 n=1 Tax=Cetraspora pellucida TaxID=1433469 RepID=A0A9N9DQY3_9GLOM|nr:21432_t:CDS:2 [Cetraspora pellucida]
MSKDNEDNDPYTFEFHELLPKSRMKLRSLCSEWTMVHTNANKVHNVFGDASKKVLPIPAVIDNYNHHIGGIDIANQLRSYYGTQVPVHHIWVPLFFWLLDTSIVNTFIISKTLNFVVLYKDFIINLVWSLIEESLEMNQKLHTQRKNVMIQSELHNQSSEKRPFYVTKKFNLPIE